MAEDCKHTSMNLPPAPDPFSFTFSNPTSFKSYFYCNGFLFLNVPAWINFAPQADSTDIEKESEGFFAVENETASNSIEVYLNPLK